MRYKLVFSYDGSAYKGYAIQPNQITIQSELEKVLSTLLNNEIKIFSSGRTDKGVHALNQVAHFDTNKEIEDLTKFKRSLNKLLNEDLFIKNIEKVDESFHARFSAKVKSYIYVINVNEYSPFFRNYELNVFGLDILKIQNASKYFIGKHNFMNFTSKEEDEEEFIREIFDIEVEIIKDRLILRFKGNGFMRYQIRKMVGTLIEIGKGKLNEEFILNNLDPKNREIVSYQSPSRGLYLEKVYY